MFLKFRYRLGYETLCREVDDSITWRRFCQIPLDGHLAHPTTLMKLTTRCGSAAVDGYSQALLAKAAQTKLLRTARLRVDTTVVPADVAYPTDSGVLARAVRRVATTAPPAACTPPAVPPAPGSATAAAPPEPGPAEFARSCGCARHKGRDKAQATVRRVTLIRDGRGELVVTPARGVDHRIDVWVPGTVTRCMTRASRLSGPTSPAPSHSPRSMISRCSLPTRVPAACPRAELAGAARTLRCSKAVRGGLPRRAGPPPRRPGGQALTPVPGLASTTAAGLARRFTESQWAAVETGLGDVHATALDLLDRVDRVDPDRAQALSAEVTIDMDTTDVEVYGRCKQGVAFNHQGQRVGRPHVAID